MLFFSKFIDTNTKEEWKRIEAALQMGTNIKTHLGEGGVIDGKKHKN